MRYHTFAIDYDGPLAEHETVSGQTVQLLRQVKESGRKLIPVTGRELTDLKKVFAQYQLFLTPSYAPIESTVPVGELNSFLLISTSPNALSQALLSRVGMVITVGDNEKYILEQFCQITHCTVPENIPGLSPGEACIWETNNQNPPHKIRYKMPQQLQHRHKRKYAFGDMAYNSFVFTGRHNKLKLKANNLMMFVQLAEGIDDDTWLYHLKRNDYKNWVDGCIHDKSLAKIMEQAAKYDPVAQTSKRIILGYIKEKYTAV